ncbi:MAG: APC family permease [Candidatus Kapabacteria bacterium]|nr:APC family permease [Candidatus Kapabacteria bacterium]
MNFSELISNTRKIFIGGKRDPHDPAVFHKISLVAFLAWIGLGSDGLSSSCYGPPEVMIALQHYPALALIIGIASFLTIVIISTSYSQIIELFPSGGGGYLVATKLLGSNAGMVSGSALLIDYVLTISVSIASGTDALFSFLPFSPNLKIPFALFFVIVLTILNMRGVKESVTSLVPIFLVFVFTHAFAIIYALVMKGGDLPLKFQDTGMQFHGAVNSMGFFGAIFLLMKAYSMGAGTYTGIEAVSNGLPILREPRVKTAKTTMRYMAASLSITVLGLIVAYLLFNVTQHDGKTLNAVLFENMTKSWGGTGVIFVIVTLISEAALLLVAAQTGFIDGPRVLSNMALDRWVPNRFSALSDRLVTQNGILLMGIASAILIIASGGRVDFLVILYSINVFITFSLSQLGMVKHWWQVRKEEKHWEKKLFINGLGLSLTLIILISVIFVKFFEGGWITIIITGSLITIFVLIKQHYNKVWRLIKKVDALVDVVESSSEGLLPIDPERRPVYDKYGKTAVLLVNGFSGLGLHSLFALFRMFDKTFSNFVFVQVGVIDAGIYKGQEEVEKFETNIKEDINKYVNFMNKNGFYAEIFTGFGLDVVAEVEKLLPTIQARFPKSVFVGGQVVLENETPFTRWLHNYTVFAVQRRLYQLGVQSIILPIKIY